jgi:hypothetical protein
VTVCVRVSATAADTAAAAAAESPRAPFLQVCASWYTVCLSQCVCYCVDHYVQQHRRLAVTVCYSDAASETDHYCVYSHYAL